MTDPQLAVTRDELLPRAHPLAIYLTALCEGSIVLVIEILGARALAPFFGTSLQVWTSQITATLLFLALGYGLGGLLARMTGRWTLPALFAVAGIWLALYPFLRTPILEFSSENLGVATGSLLSASCLFGLPLLMLGAVSPVLIAYLHRVRPGAGAAAGRLFFTNTLGGLAGGWITALWLIPHTSLRVSLLVAGIVLLVLAVAWSLVPRSPVAPLAVILLLTAIGILWLNRPPRSYVTKYGERFDVVYSHQSGIGLLQVLDYREHRQLLIDGIDQGDMTPQARLHPRPRPAQHKSPPASEDRAAAGPRRWHAPQIAGQSRNENHRCRHRAADDRHRPKPFRPPVKRRCQTFRRPRVSPSRQEHLRPDFPRHLRQRIHRMASAHA
jgi:predicted membrane-bound spermidine synthase